MGMCLRLAHRAHARGHRRRADGQAGRLLHKGSKLGRPLVKNGHGSTSNFTWERLRWGGGGGAGGGAGNGQPPHNQKRTNHVRLSLVSWCGIRIKKGNENLILYSSPSAQAKTHELRNSPHKKKKM